MSPFPPDSDIARLFAKHNINKSHAPSDISHTGSHAHKEFVHMLTICACVLITARRKRIKYRVSQKNGDKNKNVMDMAVPILKLCPLPFLSPCFGGHPVYFIRFIGDPKNDELWEGKGSRFDALWDRKKLNLCPFPSHNATFFGSPINLMYHFYEGTIVYILY